MLVVAAASSAAWRLVTVTFICFLLIIIFFVGALFQRFFGPCDLTLSLPLYMPGPCAYASVVVGWVRYSLYEHHKRS